MSKKSSLQPGNLKSSILSAVKDLPKRNKEDIVITLDMVSLEVIFRYHHHCLRQEVNAHHFNCGGLHKLLSLGSMAVNTLPPSPHQCFSLHCRHDRRAPTNVVQIKQ